MKKLFLTSILLFLISIFSIKAQQSNTIITGQISGAVCKGAAISIPFTTTGTFETGNIFKVQVRTSTSSNTWTDLVTEGNSSPLKAVIPANYDENGNFTSPYYIRVVASKPNIVGQETLIQNVHIKPNLTLLTNTLLTVNPYQSTFLNFKGSSTPFTKVVFEDSTRFELNTQIYPTSSYQHTIYPVKTTEYKLAYTENVCGRTYGTGSNKLIVNEIGIKAILFGYAGTNSICKGGVVKVSYSATGKFNSGNKFKIALRQINQTQDYEIDATEKDGIVEAIIPDNIPNGQLYAVKILTTSPQASSPLTNYNLTIGDKASAEIVSASKTIFEGQEVTLEFRVTGIGPWNINLSDGTSANYNFPGSSSPNYSTYSIAIKPTQNQNYSVSSFSSSCGSGGAGKNVMNVVVKPSVMVGEILSGDELCVGDTIVAKYVNKAAFNKATLKAVVRGNANSNPIYLPAVFENDVVKIGIPKNYYTLPNSRSSFHFVGIDFNNNELDINYNYATQIFIKEQPKASILLSTVVDLATRGTGNINVQLSGAGPVKLTFEDSTAYNAIFQGNYVNSNYTIPLQIIKTTAYKLASVSNSCGIAKISEDKTYTFRVQNAVANDITIKSVDEKICAGDKIKVYFSTIGTYKTDNEFRVELYDYFSSDRTTIVGTGKTSPIEVTIPSNLTGNEFAYIRVASSNPSWYSEKKQIRINSKPKSTLSVYYSNFQANGEITVLKGDAVSYSPTVQNSLSYGVNYKFSTGLVKTTNSSLVPLTLYPTQNTTLTLESASNECGVGSLSNNSIKIKVVPFKIVRSQSFNIGSICTGNVFTYNYAVLGTPEPNATYSFQIASRKDSIFKDVVSNTKDNPIFVTIPNTFPSGDYFMRLVSNTTEKQSSNWDIFSINTPASATLTTNDGLKTVTIEGGNFVYLKHTVKGLNPVSIITVDDKGQVYPLSIYDSQTISVTPKKTSTFYIRTVENACGYGTGSDSVKIVVTPALSVQVNGTLNICAGSEAEISYTAFGDYDNDNQFKFEIVDVTTQKVRYEVAKNNNSSGTIKLKIPTNIVPGYYQLEVTSTKPALTKKYANINFIITSLPDVTLSGNTIINSGQTTYLKIINSALKANPFYSGETLNYILSDGSGVFGGKYQDNFEVKPSKTTTYTIASANNNCGIGKVSGSATVIVNPVSDKNISTFYSGTLCTSAIESIFYDAKGTFSATNKFSVQISDKNGENFKDIPSEGDKSPLKIVVPKDLSVGENYRVRVVASDNGVSAAANVNPLISAIGPTASLDSTTYYFTQGKPVNIKINFTGTPPWSILFGTDETSAKPYYDILSTPYILKLNPINPVNYKIFSVNERVCQGQVLGTGIVRLELITANEELTDIEVKLFPNPTSDRITIQSDNFKNTTLQITDNIGRQLLQQNINKSETILDLSNYTTGQYFLQLERDSKRVVYKIMKL
jgi:Secretion system C-terminal sorting domain